FWRGDAEAIGVVDGGIDAEIAPAEGVAVEPRPGGKLAIEPDVQALGLLAAACEEIVLTRAVHATHHHYLVDAPDDGFVRRVAEVLEHADAGALGGALRQERRVGPAIFDVLEDDRRVEDRDVAV